MLIASCREALLRQDPEAGAQSIGSAPQLRPLVHITATTVGEAGFETLTPLTGTTANDGFRQTPTFEH